jgi:peptidoglycan/LPS O-acetylase OafA/YrhL
VRIRPPQRRLRQYPAVGDALSSEFTKPKLVRLEYIDGLRGICAVMVICYHYFSRWTPPKNPVNLYPYGDALYYFPLFHRAEYALMMLFVISGFVIVLTLERCRTLFEFAVRRFSRIWPALTLCCCITYLVLSILPNPPWKPSLLYFLPSLTTIAPQILNALFGVDKFDYMDGVYWTLWVDMKFYALIGVLYFTFGTSYRKPLLIGSVAVIAAFSLATLYKSELVILLLKNLLIAQFVPWFLLGIGFYYMHKDNSDWYEQPILWVALAGMELQELLAGSPLRALLALIVPVIFYAAMMVPPVTKVLSSRILTSIGAASFCMYLTHQRVGVGFMHWLGSEIELSVTAGIAVAFAVMTVVTLASMKLYDVYEQPLNQRIATAILRWKNGSTTAAIPARTWARTRSDEREDRQPALEGLQSSTADPAAR